VVGHSWEPSSPAGSPRRIPPGWRAWY
jgi:hypothetical protein